MNILEYENQIISDAQQYQAKISRDIWGVPHISGRRDSDVAFGLAFAPVSYTHLTLPTSNGV